MGGNPGRGPGCPECHSQAAVGGNDDAHDGGFDQDLLAGAMGAPRVAEDPNSGRTCGARGRARQRTSFGLVQKYHVGDMNHPHGSNACPAVSPRAILVDNPRR